MSFKISSLEHALAVAAEDVVKAARAVDKFMQKVAAKGLANQSMIENLTGLVDPQAVPIERAAFAALGLIVKAAADADAATAAKGLSISLDEQTLADFKAIYADLSGKAKAIASA